jgi:hypothetical protein
MSAWLLGVISPFSPMFVQAEDLSQNGLIGGCPELTGSFTCNAENGSTYDLSLKRVIAANGFVTYRETVVDLAPDGSPKGAYEPVVFTVDGTEASCKARKFITISIQRSDAGVTERVLKAHFVDESGYLVIDNVRSTLAHGEATRISHSVIQCAPQNQVLAFR